MKHSLALPAILILALTLSACEQPADKLASAPAQPGVTKLAGIDTQVGTGTMAEKNKRLTVHYTGWLYDPTADQQHGKQFDSSRGDDNNRPQPFSFYLGAGQVIPGWDAGIAGMKVGGRRILIVPPELAYGPRGTGRGLIPGNATLIFDIELLAVQ